MPRPGAGANPTDNLIIVRRPSAGVRSILGLLALLPGIALAQPAAPEALSWQPLVSGCFAESAHASLAQPDPVTLSPSSLRFAIAQDAGQVSIAQIDSGESVLAAPDRLPFLRFAMGTHGLTCVSRLAREECPEADAVRQQLLGLSLPVGTDFDLPPRLTLHPSSHQLEAKDGRGNHNRWRYADGAHPLRAELQAAWDALAPCWEPLQTELDAHIDADLRRSGARP